MTRIDMSTREWHELIKPVLPHTSGDKDAPELDVVRLELGDLALYAVATDRYTLAAERWPLPPADRYVPMSARQVVHLDAGEAAASLKLFTYTKDYNPDLTVIIDQAPMSVPVAGKATNINRLAVTIQEAGDGTRLVLHDVRDPSRDPLGSWRKTLRPALDRKTGRALDGLDLNAGTLARWAKAARKGERLTLYTGPKPGDPLLVTVEDHFAGVWRVPQYLDAPGKTLTGLPWGKELDVAAGIDLETGERIERSTAPALACSDPPGESCSDAGCPVHSDDDVNYAHHIRDPEGDEAAHG